MTSQPGWHPDPTQPSTGAQYGEPPRLRYWDGTRWTEHTAPAQAPAATQQYAAAHVYGQPVHSGPGRVATTPDGVPLAGWWMRVAALLLDGILLGIVGVIVSLPWLRDAWHIYRDWFDDVLRASEDGGSASVNSTQLQRDLFKPLASTRASNHPPGVFYQVGFLMWKQATPGKLLIGLRVRRRETPGPMPIGTV